MSKDTERQFLELLVVQYQETRDPQVFAEILGRVDLLLCHIVHKLKRKIAYLDNIDFMDLYQTSIIGLRDAILTAKMYNPNEKIIPRIISYANSNIRKVYRYSKKEYAISSTFTYEKDAHFDVNQDLEELYDVLKWLYKKDMLSDRDLQIVNLRFVQQKTFKEIGKDLGVTAQTVHYKVKQILKKIRIQYNK